MELYASLCFPTEEHELGRNSQYTHDIPKFESIAATVGNAWTHSPHVNMNHNYVEASSEDMSKMAFKLKVRSTKFMRNTNTRGIFNGSHIPIRTVDTTPRTSRVGRD